jgi:adenosylmethionine-8-amino-7-oxononanoate aminotransferase
MKNNFTLGEKHIWLPYTQMKNRLPQLEVKGAKGSKIFLKDGRVLIDGIASWWSSAHGYNHPHVISEITKQAKILPHIMLAGMAHETTYKLAHRLCKFAKMDRVFFSDLQRRCASL